MESALTTSAPKNPASFTARALLPMAVGPTITTILGFSTAQSLNHRVVFFKGKLGLCKRKCDSAACRFALTMLTKPTTMCFIHKGKFQA